MPYGQSVTGRQKDMIHMALCTRCGRQAGPRAEFCQACAGISAADAANQPLTAPAMAAAGDYLRPFAAEGPGPALLPEAQGPDYWTDPFIGRIPAYPEPVQSDPPPDAAAPPGTFLPAPDQAFSAGGDWSAGTAGTRGMLQPYGPDAPPYEADEERYPTTDPPYAVEEQPYPVPDAPYAADQTAHADGPGGAGYYATPQSYQASAGYSGPNAPWGALPREDLPDLGPDLTDQDALGYEEPAPSLPTGLAGHGGATHTPADSAQPTGRRWGSNARRVLRRHAPAEAEPDDDDEFAEAGASQPYPGGPVPLGGAALAMTAIQTGRAIPDSAGANPADVPFAADESMLAAGGRAFPRADSEPESGGFPNARLPLQQRRWVAFAAAAIVLIIASAGAAILLSHRATPPSHHVSGGTAERTTAPAPKPTTSPLITVAPAAASAPQAPAVRAFLTRYFTAINDHDFAAYRSLFSDTQRGGLSAAAFAAGYGSSRDSRATLHNIAASAAGRLVVTVTFVSHQQPTDSATHSSCTAWTISLYLTKQAGAYVIQAPPAGYGATATACS